MSTQTTTYSKLEAIPSTTSNASSTGSSSSSINNGSPPMTETAFFASLREWLARKAEWITGSQEVVSLATKAVAELEKIIDANRKVLTEKEKQQLRDIKDEYYQLRIDVMKACVRMETSFLALKKQAPQEFVKRIKSGADGDVMKAYAEKAGALSKKIRDLMDSLKDKIVDSPLWKWLGLIAVAVALLAGGVMTGGALALAAGAVLAPHLLIGGGILMGVGTVTAIIAKVKEGGDVSVLIHHLQTIHDHCMKIMEKLSICEVKFEVYKSMDDIDLGDLLKAISELKKCVEF